MKVIMFPGQGSQFKGMGTDLFKVYRDKTAEASAILGYDLEELCLHDPNKELNQTQFTQPAIFFVNALRFIDKFKDSNPGYFIGHSLGEYSALYAAGVFDLETGLKLVQRRAVLMAEAAGGGMAAIVGLEIGELNQKLADYGYADIDIANYNSPLQHVIAGPQNSINQMVGTLSKEQIKIVPLRVSAPFHSRYMKSAAQSFAKFLEEFSFQPLLVPVIANINALPYNEYNIKENLSNQISGPVRWAETIRYLIGKGSIQYEEVGSSILTKMVAEIKTTLFPPMMVSENESPRVNNKMLNGEKKPEGFFKNIHMDNPESVITDLGNKNFIKEYNVSCTYVAGSMYNGISSVEMVVRMGKAGMLSFLGTKSLSLNRIQENLQAVQSQLIKGEPYGCNLWHDGYSNETEMDKIKLYIQSKMCNLEVANFQEITEALVYYRLTGLVSGSSNGVICNHRIIAKVNSPEVAEMFMRPAPLRIVMKLLNDNLVTEEQAYLAKHIPMSHDICVETDSGSFTNRKSAMATLPSAKALRSIVQKEMNYALPIRIGLGGGIGTPEAAACAYMMGADFILTGSINQCTVQADIHNSIKDKLQQINVQDTDYVFSGDLSNSDSYIQVLKKGVLFSVRANKLLKLLIKYESLESLPGEIIEQLESNYFRRSLNKVWEDINQDYRYTDKYRQPIEGDVDPQIKMALVFQSYFTYTNNLLFNDVIEDHSNLQIHTGPALGAFNQWVKGTSLEDWRNRHVDDIGLKIMAMATTILKHSGDKA